MKQKGALQTSTNSDRNQQWTQSSSLLRGGIGKVHGGLFIPMKVTMKMNQVLIEQGDLLYSIWNNSSGHDFLEFNLLCYSWIVYS